MLARTNSDRFRWDSTAMSWIIEQIFKDPMQLIQIAAREHARELTKLNQELYVLERMTVEERREYMMKDPLGMIQRKIHFDAEQLRIKEDVAIDEFMEVLTKSDSSEIIPTKEATFISRNAGK